ncbi:LysM peptidoglycan-binding domain-containing protein [Tetragenococcus halophilus]|uniref:LysM peptidoglycan-binding domain-containing protein n=12 Tax=Tetragenococcus halophilus TaxID=51669 RepID=UPI00209A9FFC|nr:LysM peptidoglycan-binding domain-containing protein [Tetragenococcus halophilus]MCO8284265.1 LysM peptidoglycan-binding domain-containing protein [Tetragenococcus halophilus]
MRSSLTRKERRKVQERMSLYGNVKKGAAVVGTTVTAVSMVAPLLPVDNVFAEEADSSVVASYESDYESEDGAQDFQSQTDDPTVEEPSAEAENNVTQDNSVEAGGIEQAEEPADNEVTYDQAQQFSTERENSQDQVQPQEEQEPEEDVQQEEQTSEDEEQDAEAEEDLPETPEEEAEQLQEIAGQHPGDQGPVEASTFSAQLSPEPSAFIEEFAAHAAPVAESNNLYASVMIAQAVVESGWGSSALSQAPNHNLFGIKGSYNGQSVTMPTQEYINGRYVTVDAAFRKYPSYTASFQDNAALLSTSLYSGAWKSNTNSYKDATAALTGLYATAPDYNTVLNGIIESYDLTRFDSGNDGGMIDTGTGGNENTDENTGEDNNSANDDNSSNSNSSTYTVQAGDSVWLIADQNGITMNQLRDWNNIQNDFVYPGQELTVSKDGSSDDSNNSNGTGNSDNNSNSSNNGSSTYTVKAGDSVWLIADQNGITMNQLRDWNNIQNDFVYPGQELTVSNGSSSNNSNSNSSSNSNNSSGGSYTVKAGDSVWLIADQNGITMNQLRDWNNIQNDFVYPGQELTVSNGSSSNNSNSNSSSNSNNSSGGSYTVKAGDSVWLIADQNGITMNQLRDWNNIQNDFVYPGQKLTVSKGSNSNNSNSNSSSNSNNSSGGSYTVKAGDSVWLIADQNGITMNQLRDWNNVQNDFVYPGQKLTVSNGSSTFNSSNNSGSSNTQHKVKSGDSLWMISQEYDISVSRLKSINNLNSDTIFIGQNLKVN